MECKRIFIIAPPFYSHFSPMMALAVCFRRAGASVVVGCSASFSDSIKGAGLEFAELEITRNANTGVAEKTEQPAEEAERIRAFIEATKRGALETLRFQNRNRQLDMLADPERIREEINVFAGRFKPDFFVVDQLSYAVSLALYCLQLPFITFCPGHPTYIPQEDQLFGVPYAWPPEFDIADMELAELRNEASGVRDHFTAMFNAIIQEYDSRLPLIRDAFRFASESAQLFNYPDFGGLHKDRDGPKKIFLGYCFTEEGLNRSWQEMLAAAGERYPRVLVSFGTFLSAREDVLRKTVAGIANRFPQSLCIVSAGASAPALRDLENDGTIVR
ncbi:MAG: glycosyl transferase, partial [Spirochaetales bacterium]